MIRLNNLSFSANSIQILPKSQSQSRKGKRALQHISLKNEPLHLFRNEELDADGQLNCSLDTQLKHNTDGRANHLGLHREGGAQR